MTKHLKFRTRAGLAAVFAILMVIGLAVPSPLPAQTVLSCVTAVGALNGTKYAGRPLRLLETFSDAGAVEEILTTNNADAYVSVADTVQIFSVGTDGFMVMASIQGCHVAHFFTDDPIVMKSEGAQLAQRILAERVR